MDDQKDVSFEVRRSVIRGKQSIKILKVVKTASGTSRSFYGYGEQELKKLKKKGFKINEGK